MHIKNRWKAWCHMASWGWKGLIALNFIKYFWKQKTPSFSPKQCILLAFRKEEKGTIAYYQRNSAVMFQFMGGHQRHWYYTKKWVSWGHSLLQKMWLCWRLRYKKYSIILIPLGPLIHFPISDSWQLQYGTFILALICLK